VADMTGVLTLNEVASSVFDAIDGKNTINDILLQLIEAYDVEMEVLEQDVEQFIKAAQTKQLIDKIDN
jgi:coenzyme PQQ biosynthesis protein PqqD